MSFDMATAGGLHRVSPRIDSGASGGRLAPPKVRGPCLSSGTRRDAGTPRDRANRTIVKPRLRERRGAGSTSPQKSRERQRFFKARQERDAPLTNSAPSL